MMYPTASPPTAPPAGDVDALLEQRVEQAQFELMFERTHRSNLVALPFGLLLTWMLWNVVLHDLLLAWLAGKWLVSGARAWIAHRRARADAAAALRWSRRYEWVLAVDGAIYGLIGTLLLPPSLPEVAALLLATTIGVAAIGLIVLSMRLRTCLLFCSAVLVPPLIGQLFAGTRLSLYAALAMGVFLALIVSEGRRAAAATRTMLRLRFEMDEAAAQRQQALDLAQRHSEAKGRFLATMSHEMRTPLHGMLGLAALARTDAVQAPRYLDMLERAGRHLLDLINDVLDYSKIERGFLKPAPPQAFDLTEAVASVAELARVSAVEKGLAFVLDGRLPSPCWVGGDPARLRQVLLNLTGNAVKFTERGCVTLALRRADDGRTTFEVTDTGPGIPAGERERLFEPFHQLDTSFGRRHGGAGLGLAIARELARAMGGDVRCVDRGAGPGACFELVLPLPDSAAPAAAPAPADARALSGDVLLVEDNPVNALVAQAMLERAGLRVEAVGDGAAALDRALRRRYDLVLMDCQMPGMDGFEATRRIRAAERAAGAAPMVIVALTANALEGDRERSLAAGMDEHLAKPYDEPALRALLQKLLTA
ncbi:MAG: response regulator [Piscinibacter sp.]|nr:response regulator [Piscinibacter sp.]